MVSEGDGFVGDAAELAAFADALSNVIADPFDLDGEAHVVDLAIGVAAGPPNMIDDVRLAEEVEDALAQSRNDHAPVVRDLSQPDPMIDALALRRELPGAIERGEMFLQYQPKVQVRRQEVASAEALVRWRHPTRGLLLPDDFIPLAEITRDIDRLTLWTIEQVIADQALLRGDGQNITIFINISGQLLSNAKFVKRACEIVTATDVSLGFEITETSVIRDPVSAIANLNVFADHGIVIAIDEYGAGLSRLANLKHHTAIERATAARADAQRLPGTAGETALATATWLLGEAYVRDNQIEKGGPLINAALATIGRVAPGTKLNGDALLSRGNYNARNANVSGALTDIQAAFEIYRKIGETRSQAIALLTISALYLDANDYNGALKYVDQALEVYHGDPLLLVSMHNNRGDMLRELGRYGEAEAEFGKAMDLARGLKSPALLLPILRNVARNELAAGKLDAADRTLAEAFRQLGSSGSPGERAKVLAVSAQARFQRGDLTGARSAIDRAFQGLDSADDTQFRQARKTAYEIYKSLGDKPNALAQLEALKALDDNISKLHASTSTALMAARFDSANQDLKIAKLQAAEAKRKLEFETARARTQFWIFVGSGITAIVIFGMLGFGLITLRRSRNEVRAANVDLAATTVALGKALAAKTEFLATPSHEIRTPLNGIHGLTQVLLADHRLAPTLRARIGVVHGTSVSMRALVDDILDVAKMETGNLTIEKAPVDLPAMLKDVSRMWEDQARAKGLAFELDVSGAPSRIESDPARLRQVVFNLLSNALKFTHEGSVHASSDVIDGADGEQVTIAIRDTGIGVPLT